MFDYGIDIDGVLTIETSGHDYENRTPNISNIEKIRSLSESCSVCFYSARRPCDLEVTKKWLAKYNLDGPVFLGKPLCKQYVDDRMAVISSIGRRSCLLFTGGMDSLIAYHYLAKPDCLYFDLGHRYAEKEKSAVAKLVPSARVLSMIKLAKYELSDACIPGRNLYLAMAACSEGYDRISLIVQKDETNIPDRTKLFSMFSSALLSDLFERDIVVDTPFWDMDKTDMLRWYVLNGHDLDAVVNVSTSCYHPSLYQCGSCSACFRKAVAMANAGLLDLSCFFENPFQSNVAKEYLGSLAKYPSSRQERILNAFKIHQS